MVRLMLTLTPIVCVAAAMAISTLLDTYLAPLATGSGGSNGGVSQPVASTSAPLSTMIKKSEKRREFFGITNLDVKVYFLFLTRSSGQLLFRFAIYSSNSFFTPPG
jgi:hypothetical protein